MISLDLPSPLQPINIKNDKGISFLIKRDDLIHPAISGNKWRKLKCILAHAKEESYEGILTFGGAYSNHILATAAAAKKEGFKSIGVIRGEARSINNATLSKASEFGMELYFISREEYKQKADGATVQELIKTHPEYYLIPEGGKHQLALSGIAEIITELDSDNNKIDYMLCAVGTGTTFAGLAKTKRINQLIGIPVLKHATIQQEIEEELLHEPLPLNCKLLHDYHFGGYAKFNEKLIAFMHDYHTRHNIPTDVIYTSKLMYAALDMLNKDYFVPDSTVCLYHSGGIQGNAGMNERFPNIVKF
jgi:1-aminocyclopropane-1-carboxylate deaminase